MSSAMGQLSFNFAAAKDWNDLPKELGALGSIFSFKTKVFKLVFLGIGSKATCPYC